MERQRKGGTADPTVLSAVEGQSGDALIPYLNHAFIVSVILTSSSSVMM